MKAKNITHVEEPEITIDYVNDLLAKIEAKEVIKDGDIWLPSTDDKYDINVYDNEFYADGEPGYKYTVYRVVDGNTDVSGSVAHGDIDM